MIQKKFDPVDAARHIARSYSEYLATTIRFCDVQLQTQLENILTRPGFLAKGPFLEATPPYTKGVSVRQLVNSGVLCEGMLELGNGNRSLFDPDLVLYEHQVTAIRKAKAGKNYIVTTGTGSGKTECFLLPIIDDILREQKAHGPSAGVRAMILYPMNALANDQLKRLRQLLLGTKITFGRYVGDTPEGAAKGRAAWEKDHVGEEPLQNELLSREEMRIAPPNILLTNYSMLEYLLLRPKDAPFFSSVFGSNWRHIAIDEAHVYSGTLGTEIAFLLRRLKARVSKATGKRMALHCYATSATMGTDADRPQIAKFAEDLFGEPFDHEGNPAVIGSHQDDPMSYFRKDKWGALPADRWKPLRDAVASGNPTSATLRNVLEGAVPDEAIIALDHLTPRGWLSWLLLGEENSEKIVRRVTSNNDLFDLTDLACIESLDIEDLHGDIEGAAALSAMVEVLSFTEFSEGVPILASRYHTFFRAPEGVFLCPDDMSLTPERTYERLLHDGLSVPVYEVSVCRHCGEAYILGTASTTKNYTWLDPRKPDINSDDYAVRSYYRLLSNKEDVDKDEEVMWLCTKCGTLHSSREGGPHRHPHGMCDRILIARGRANENVAKCGHCGYQNRYAIQPMRVSPEAAGSIVCYDLVRDVLPFEQKMTEDNLDDLFGIDQCGTVKGGNIICFSDRRQDAAYFAPAMLRTYNNVTKRQIIREAVTSLCLDGGSCRPSDIAKWIAHKRKTQYRFDGAADTDIDRRNEANGWILDELMAEDSRNSLEGLGLVEVSPGPLLQLYNEKPTAFEQLAKKAANSRPGLSWLMPSDYFTTMRVGLETLREQGAIKRPDGCQSHMTVRFRQTPFVIGDTDDSPRGTIHYVGSPRGNGNKRSSFIISLARRKHGVSISRDDAETLLGILYEDTVKVLRTLGRRDGTEYIFNDSATGGYLLSANLWTLRPQDESANLYLCNICGCMSQYDTGGVCLTRNCDGWPQRVDATEVKGKDQYYKVTYREEPLPIRVEEHTAQLSTKQAAKIQQDFIDGKVNVLSCTTTFELGVDVGDLRATFMRNVPPSPANYAQRAGRVGRRAGKPGFAVTFARLRPHDIEYFRMPAKIIAGETKAPSCYLSNPSIAIRHVFAVVLSEYFRSGNGRETSAGDYNDFMAIKEVRPTAIKAVRDFISSHRSNLDNQLSEILPKVVSESTEIGLSEGTWIERLLGDGGRLMRAHALVHEDWDRLERSAQMAKDEGKYDKASRNIKMQGNLYKKKTIEVLAESGVLPKYGFPTDLVQLFLVEQENALPDERLELSRGLRQAIREYAPGSEIVAGKRVWHSCGIAKPRERSYETRRFGVCSNKDCRAFVVPIDTGEDEMDCPLCSSKIKLTNRILVPSSGFRGKEVPGRNATLRRPRNHGFIDIKFVQNWTDGNELSWVEMPGGKLGIRYAGNGMLYAINRGPSSRGFKVCSYCGAAAPAEEQITHEKWCISKETQHYTGLGTDFTTDVLELTFALDDRHPRDPSEWRSLMWALVQAAVSLMNIPEGEIGATAYTNFNTGDESVLLYDNVPGGAGRVLQLNRDIDGLLQKAYEIVSTCDCGEDSCCYGCLCNYHNQGEQDQLSRGAAMRILGALMNQLAE